MKSSSVGPEIIGKLQRGNNMNLYLHQIKIPYQEANQKKRYTLYQWHQFVWELFGDPSKRDRDFLFRLQEDQDSFQLLVQGNRKIPPQKNLAIKTKAIPEAFFQHPTYRFSLLANPTVKKKSDASGKLLKNSRRVAITQNSDLDQWIKRKSTLHGFSILKDSLHIQVQNQQFFKKAPSGEAPSHQGWHHRCLFEAILQVTDRPKFLQTVQNGIGSARGFGFGMLCLQPINF